MAKRKVTDSSPRPRAIPAFPLPVLKELLGQHTVERLKLIYFSLKNEKITLSMRKEALVELVAEFLDFQDQSAFDSFFTLLPELSQDLIRSACFCDCLDTIPFQKKGNPEILLTSRSPYYYSQSNVRLNPALRIEWFQVLDPPFIRIAEPFRTVFARWLPMPEDYPIAATTPPTAEIWSNAANMVENLPLLIEAIAPIIEEEGPDAAMRKKLGKSATRRLREKCGLPAFPLAGPLGLDPIDMLKRFIPALYRKIQSRPEQIEKWIKYTLQSFFEREKTTDAHTRWFVARSGDMLEYSVLSDHINSSHAQRLGEEWQYPESRRILKSLLDRIAPTDDWYSITDLSRSLERQGLMLFYTTREWTANYLYIKADQLILDKHSISGSYDDHIFLRIYLQKDLLHRPLLAAYFYLLASLGVIEFTERPPEPRLMRNGKRLPVSPYDAMDKIRITDFGRWALGYSDVEPKRAQLSFEAIADRELLLVTFRGKSLERKLYLEQIGERLGVERFRISPASFIRDCQSRAQVQDRIDAFKRLIDENPAPHWVELFNKAIFRIGAFSHPQNALLFDLGGIDAELREILLNDNDLKALTLRAEGNHLVLVAEAQKKFRILLQRHGIVFPD